MNRIDRWSRIRIENTASSFFPNGPTLATDQRLQWKQSAKKLSMDSTGDHVQRIPHGLRSDHRRKYLRSHRLGIPKHEPSKLDINQLPHHQHRFSTTIRVVHPGVSRVLTRETDQ